ncbi:hypothetical protein LFM09_18065 [Lentzea alba]|uniref:aminotransferase class I/II-fold pyridoxal phosphate-dependent enzyme n=1 Tax=Lentzea alba TaxID=2714351 RepID=UPI0039BF3302
MDLVAHQHIAGSPVLHLGFGEAGRPVLPEAASVHASAAGENGYGPVAGSSRARESVSGDLARSDLPTDPDQVIVAPGSKALLYAALAALPGDVVLPVPSWVSLRRPDPAHRQARHRRPDPRLCRWCSRPGPVGTRPDRRACRGCGPAHPDPHRAGQPDRHLRLRRPAQACRPPQAAFCLYPDLEPLRSDDPVALPWIASSLGWLRTALHLDEA